MAQAFRGTDFSKIFENNRKMIEAFAGSGISKVFEDNKKMIDMITGSGISKVFEDNKKMIDMRTGSGISKVFEDNKKMIDMITGSGISKVFEDNKKMIDMLTGSGFSKIFENNRKMVEAFTKFQDFSSTAGVLNKNSGFFEGYQEFLKSIDPVDKNRLIEIAEESMLLEQEDSETSLSEVFDEFEAVTSPEGIKEFCYNHPIIIIFLAWFINFMLNNIAQPVWDHFEEIFKQKVNNERVISKEKAKEELRNLNIRDDLVEKFRYIKADALNVRESHSMKSTIIDKLHFGDSVEFLSKRNKWVRIKYKNSRGDFIEGWVYSKYISKFRSSCK